MFASSITIRSISEKEFNEWNPEAKSGIKEGQSLKVGLKNKNVTTTNSTTNSTSVPLQNYETYTVQKGETVYAITKKFNLNVDDFYNWNPESKNGLSEGQVVKVGAKKNESAVVNNSTPQVITTDTVVSGRSKKSEYTIGLFLPFEFNYVDNIPSRVL